jgi:hypothetical protein
MRDKGWIGAGLVVFVVLMTFPIWYNLVDGEKVDPPTLSYPHEGGQCVEDTAYMTANHMRLLKATRRATAAAMKRVLPAPV